MGDRLGIPGVAAVLHPIEPPVAVHDSDTFDPGQQGEWDRCDARYAARESGGVTIVQ